jgi:PKD repeat protein
MIHDYVNRVYKLDCSGGCVIPIKITSNEDQQMNITNVSMIINAGNQQYLPPGDPNLYNISTSVPTMSSSGYRTFSLANANFTVPESFGTQNITLSVQDGSNEYALLSREVTINKIPTVGTVDPQIAIAAIPTNFTAKINNYNSTVNITKYIWDFGDGNIQTTYTNSVAHTYNSLGWFNGNVTIVNPAGNSTTSFKVNVQTPQDAVNQLLGKKLANFDAISTKLSGMPEFAQTAVKSAINFDNLSKALNDLKAANGTASSPEVYVAIMKSLLALNVPDSLSQTSVANSVIFIQNQSNIDLDALREIGGGNYDSSQSKYYLDYISLWAIKNTTMIVNYEEYSATYGDYVEPLTDIVDLHIGSKPSRSGYVIIPKLKGITFNQQPQKEGDFYYVPLAGDSLDVQFSTSQQLNPTALPMFVAPSLSSIPVPEGGITKKTSYKFLILIFILMGIALIGGTAYIVLGKWYQKRYESYLFKNKNDLYNIVTYIHTAKIKGVKDRDIERNLRRSEWNSEQIGYVMKKYAGKGIGLPGFIKRNRQMKKDIQMKAMKSANKNRFTPNNPNIGKRMPPKG